MGALLTKGPSPIQLSSASAANVALRKWNKPFLKKVSMTAGYSVCPMGTAAPALETWIGFDPKVFMLFTH